MYNSFEFMSPRCIFGEGATKRIPEILASFHVKKLMAVYDKGVKAAGIVDPMLDNIRNAGYEVLEFDEVNPDPDQVMVEKLADIAKKAGVELFIAIGGGSSLDTVKGACILQTNPGKLADYAGIGMAKNPCIPWFAVPTTSGTGSEVTALGIFSDFALQKKYMVKDVVKLPASFAFMDPSLVLGLPASITAATGMDALSHAVEGYTIPKNNPVCDALNLDAIRRIFKWLPIAVENGKNIEARSEMMLASTLAGLGFANTSLHIGHTFGHALGACLHIPHGVACTLSLPYAMIHAGEVMPIERLSSIAQAMGIVSENKDRLQLLDDCVNAIKSLGKKVRIKTIEELGFGADEYLEKGIEFAKREVYMCQASGQPLTDEKMREYMTDMWKQ